MKLKKICIAILIIGLLSIPQSVFALRNVGDTQTDAIPFGTNINHEYSVDLILSDNADVDWFRWDNYTGEDRRVTTFLGMLNGNSGIYKMGIKIKYSNGTETSLMYSELYTYGNSSFSNIYVPAGASVFLKIDAVNFVSMYNYYRMFFTHSSI
jgi:hypothetical protein